VSVEADFWAGLFVDLGVRVEWLGQALDAVPTEDASAAAVVRLHSYAHALRELSASLERVHTHRADPELEALFVLDGPLAGFLSRLYAWCEEIGTDFERMAAALRRREPTSIVFTHKKVDESYAQFDALMNAIRRADAALRQRDGASDPQKWQTFSEHLEELMWATEWVHLALVRRPGD
jgi:hypothetical protein